MSFAEELRKHNVNPTNKATASHHTRKSVWEGPLINTGKNGGITFSMLNNFLVDRERFRLKFVEGLALPEGFNHRLEYGNMWHLCEECVASPDNLDWQWHLREYAQSLVNKYPTSPSEIEKWYRVCRAQFPAYLEYWLDRQATQGVTSNHPDLVERTQLASEFIFDVQLVLPSSRVVRLRGKWDSIDLVTTDKHKEIWLQENKTKGDIDELAVGEQLKFDLQTMIYLIALHEEQHRLDDSTIKNLMSPKAKANAKYRQFLPIAGVRYNVVRRPLSGGRHTIRQHQPTKANPAGERLDDYYDRLGGLIASEPEYFFMRWNVRITEPEVTRFKEQCLFPVLEQLCDWWEWISKVTAAAGGDPFHPEGKGVHWRHPYGIFNIMNQGGHTEYDNYLDTGSTGGLSRCTKLFPELQERTKP